MINPENKTVLLIAYYFPPLGMGGVGRPYALFRYLPDNGYNVIVITVKDIFYPQHDYSLLKKDDNQNIYRTGSLDPARLLYLLGKRKQGSTGYPNLSKRLPIYFPDLKRGWIPFASRKLKRIIRDHDISAVITTSPPPSVHLLGLKLKKKYDMPWIADFRDFWFPLPIEKVYPKGFMKNYSLGLKSEVTNKADEVIAVNNDISRYLGRGEVIMNAADQSVIEAWQRTSGKKNGILTIGAFGTFNYLFPIEPLLEAVQDIMEKNLISRDKIQIIQVGHTDNAFKQLAQKYMMNDIVVFKGYLDKIKAVEAMLPADILYLGVNKFDDYNILPGRAFDCLVSGKPIIGVVPANSDIADLLDNYPNGTAVTDYDSDKIVRELVALYSKKMDGVLPAGLNHDLIENFSMPTLAKRYAAVLNRLLK